MHCASPHLVALLCLNPSKKRKKRRHMAVQADGDHLCLKMKTATRKRKKNRRRGKRQMKLYTRLVFGLFVKSFGKYKALVAAIVKGMSINIYSMYI